MEINFKIFQIIVKLNRLIITQKLAYFQLVLRLYESINHENRPLSRNISVIVSRLTFRCFSALLPSLSVDDYLTFILSQGRYVKCLILCTVKAQPVHENDMISCFLHNCQFSTNIGGGGRGKYHHNLKGQRTISKCAEKQEQRLYEIN